MQKTSILLIGPDSDDSSPEDQSLAARLAAGPDITLFQQRFRRDVPHGLERQMAAWDRKVTGVVGTMRVAESQLLGRLCEQMNLLCFIANNNPAVWQQRRHVFHIGFPTSQTTAAIAQALLRNTGRRRYLMLHDRTEFQTRVAANMETHLRHAGVNARSLAHNAGDPLDLAGWEPELVYVVFSSERKALQVVEAVRHSMPDIPVVLGRSLLRESFLMALQGQRGEFWFVDTNFRHGRAGTEAQQTFMKAMAENTIAVPTTNHAFGWDCMRFCAAALRAGGGDPQRAIAWLESGVKLEGAGGTCSFTNDNHNGRHGPGPTVLTRWSNGKLSEERGDA